MAHRTELAGPTVRVSAPARLHLGFLDPASTLGRPFGSLGLVIDAFETVVELDGAPEDALSAGTAAAQAQLGRVRSCVDKLRQHTGRGQPLRLHLADAPPAHAGLGSGTQLALAVGRAFARWHRLDIPTATLAGWLDRGRRSGVGIAGFDQGGLLLDGGPGADHAPAPLLSRMVLPDAWRVLLVMDPGHQGLSGPKEKQAIAALEPLPREAAADICHQVLMRVLPGAACGDFAAFAAGVTQIQQRLGDHFAPAQGGSGYTSAAVGQLVQWIGEAFGDGGAAIGQSSWGPTGFAIMPSQAAAEAALSAARAAGLAHGGLDLRIVRPRHSGATVE